jgi:hypothetical protein
MERLKKKKVNREGSQLGESLGLSSHAEDPLQELNDWFQSKPLSRDTCQNAIPWWGVSTVLR